MEDTENTENTENTEKNSILVFSVPSVFSVVEAFLLSRQSLQPFEKHLHLFRRLDVALRFGDRNALGVSLVCCVVAL